jgi:hypothetical protein
LGDATARAGAPAEALHGGGGVRRALAAACGCLAAAQQLFDEMPPPLLHPSPMSPHSPYCNQSSALATSIPYWFNVALLAIYLILAVYLRRWSREALDLDVSLYLRLAIPSTFMT